MSIEEAIKILDYKINMYKEDVFIGDLDKTNIEAIKKVLKEIERLNNIINELENYLNEDDWSSVNGEVAIKLIKNKIRKLKGVDKE